MVEIFSPSPATRVKLLRLCSSALIFLSSWSSEMMCLTWASELPLNWPHMASRFTGLGYEASIMSNREVLVASG